MSGKAVPDTLSREESLEQALRIILFKAHKRKMLKDPPPLDSWWGEVMKDPYELVMLIEPIGDIAYEALKQHDK